MQARIDNPALTVPGALKALQELANAASQAGIPETTLELVRLRASQINGCSGCVDLHSRTLRHWGEPDARIHMVAAWRDAQGRNAGRVSQPRTVEVEASFAFA